MAADVNILREFLVRIGFTVDDAQFKKIENTLGKAEGWISELGEATGAVAYIVEKNVTRIAESFDHLYYSSQRVGSSVSHLQAFQFGATQIGVSADEAASAVAGLNRALRDNPGTAAQLNMMGIRTAGRQTTDIADDFIDKITNMPPMMRTMWASQLFGWDSDTTAALVRNHPAMKRYEAEHNKRLRDAGFDPDTFSNQSNDFMIQMRTLQDETDILKATIARDWLPTINKMVEKLEGVLEFFGKHHGLLATSAGVGALGSIGALAGGLHMGRGLLRWMMKPKGAADALESAGKAAKGGRGWLYASAGEEAATAGAGEAVGMDAGLAAAGEGIGGAVAFGTGIGEIAVIVATVAAVLGISIYEIHKHWDQIQNASDRSRDWIDGKLAKAGQAIKTEARKEITEGNREIKVATTWLAKGLDSFTKHAEGLRLSSYGDQAGNGTIGYGHKIKRGERFGNGISQTQADELYRADMAGAQKAVARLTKGLNLNSGQLNALADFTYNEGAPKLAKSTLLRLVRSGQFEAAAREFEKWDLVKVNGQYQHSRGLHDRRLGDEAMFRGGTNVHVQTKIDVHGVQDPHAAARETSRLQGQTYADVVHNNRGVGH